MKTLFLIMALLTGMNAQASSQAQCRFITGDVGDILGQGKNRYEAYQNAVEICVDRRAQLYQAYRGQPADMDKIQDFIDTCTTLECKK